MIKLRLDGPILGPMRTHRRQDVQATARAMLERVARAPVFKPLINVASFDGYYQAVVLRQVTSWSEIESLIDKMTDEPRALVDLTNERSTIEIQLCLNCTQEIVKEKVGGRRRSVPKASDTSLASVKAEAHWFTEPAFRQAYLALAADVFDLIGGEWGWIEHLHIHHGTEFDRFYQDFFEPWLITWANLFGPELVDRFGRERLLNAPAHQHIELPGGGMVLTVCASPLEQLEPAAQEAIARLKTHLGILSPSERASPEELAAFEARSAAAEAEMKQRIEEAFRQAREQTAAEMQRQAEGCVEGVRQFWGERLDFSPRSLAVVDRLIRTGFGPQADDETIATATQAFGAYAGEVVRRTFGGVWHDEEMEGQPVVLNVGKRSVRVEPFRVVSRRFEHGHGRADDLFAWYEKIGDQTKSH